MDVTNFFKRQQRNNAVLDAHRDKLGIKKGLDEAGATRFSFHYNVLHSIAILQPALQAAVLDVAFNTGTSTTSRERAVHIKQLLLNDDWWRRVGFVVDVLKPVKDAIDLVQADACCQADAFFIWRSMVDELKTAVDLAAEDEELAAELESVMDALLERFEYGRSNMMILSALLHPKYR